MHVLKNVGLIVHAPVQYETRMSEVERKNQQWNPKYLHALVSVQEAEEGKDEDGVLNGVKKLLKEERKHYGERHEERMKTMEQTIAQMEATIQAMNANQKQMEEKINSQLMTILQAVRPQK